MKTYSELKNENKLKRQIITLEKEMSEVLKMAYKYVMNSSSVGTEEIQDKIADSLCNLIGHESYLKFQEESEKDMPWKEGR